MSRWYKNKAATVIVEADNGDRMCILYDTVIVRWSKDMVSFASGGHYTVTTKRRINEVIEHEGLPQFSVYQTAGVWYVVLPSGGEVPFSEGVTFRLFNGEWVHDLTSVMGKSSNPGMLLTRA